MKISDQYFGEEEISTVDARELWVKLEVKSNFRDWIDRRIKEAKLVEGQDFIVSLKNERNPLGGRPSKEYTLSLDAAKHIAMMEGTEKGREIRQSFIDFERKAKKALLDIANRQPQTDDDIIAHAMMLAGNKLLALEEEKTQLLTDKRHAYERVGFLECQMSLTVTETRLKEAPDRLMQHWCLLGGHKEAYGIIYNAWKKRYRKWLPEEWKEQQRSRGKGYRFFQFLMDNGLAEKYLQLVEALIKIDPAKMRTKGYYHQGDFIKNGD